MVLTVACLISISVAASSSPTASTSGEQQAAAAPASATEVKVGLGIENLDVTGASDSFNIAPDTKVYGWARVRDVAADSAVSIIFKKGDKEVYKKEVTIPSVPYRINAYRTFRSWDAGEWTLSIVGPGAKELASTTFKVEITK